MDAARGLMRMVATSVVAVTVACGGDGGGGGVGVDPPVFTSLTLAPASATVLVGATQTLTATAKDQRSQTMSGLSVTYASDNQGIATVTAGGVVTGVAAGTAHITATGTIGSVTKTATADITVSNTLPLTASVTATTSNSFNPGDVRIAVGGTVEWTFATLHNVTFGSNPPSNIPNTSNGTVSRTFPTAGTFNYECTIHPGMNGRVIVQ